MYRTDWVKTFVYMVFVLLVAAWPVCLAAQCSLTEQIATFVVTGVEAGSELQVTTLFVLEKAADTFPTDEQMISSIGFFAPNNIQKIDEFEAFSVFSAEASDSGVDAIIDRRTGAVVYRASIEWWVAGTIQTPEVSNFEWASDESGLAPPPLSVDVSSGLHWYSVYFGDPQVLSQAVVDLLRTTDTVKSFGACGDYQVLCYFTNLWGQGTTALYAIVVVYGACGPPWNGSPVGTETTTWGTVKALYRN